MSADKQAILPLVEEKPVGTMNTYQTKRARDDSLFRQYITIFAVVSAYWLVSITMVFANKTLLSGDSLRAPFFITGFQCVATVLLCATLSHIAPLVSRVVTLPTVQFRPQLLLKVLPLSVVFVGMIVFNNLCLQNVDVSFYYIGRSLTTVFNVLCSFLILGQRTCVSSLVCCAVIILGFLLGVDQEKVVGTLSVSGVVFGVLASFFVSLYAIFTKKVLSVVDGSVWQLSFINNINAAIMLAVLMFCAGETRVVMHYERIGSPHFWLLMSLAGVFGLAIGYVTGLQIQVTSPLTHNISGTAKACAQTVLGSWWAAQWRSQLWWLGNLLVLSGSAAYTRVKQKQMAAAAAGRARDSNMTRA